MAYKDKEKQREAVRLATSRYRQKLKGITGITATVIPCDTHSVILKADIKEQSHNPRMVGYVPPRTS